MVDSNTTSQGPYPNLVVVDSKMVPESHIPAELPPTDPVAWWIWWVWCCWGDISKVYKASRFVSSRSTSNFEDSTLPLDTLHYHRSTCSISFSHLALCQWLSAKLSASGEMHECHYWDHNLFWSDNRSWSGLLQTFNGIGLFLDRVHLWRVQERIGGIYDHCTRWPDWCHYLDSHHGVH